jgi:hypothetical protein
MVSIDAATEDLPDPELIVSLGVCLPSVLLPAQV